MPVEQVAHPSIDERKAMGREAGDRTPPSSHAKWRPATDRPDPVALLEEQNVTREPDLVPVRHGRTMVLAVLLLLRRREDHGGGLGGSRAGLLRWEPSTCYPFWVIP